MATPEYRLTAAHAVNLGAGAVSALLGGGPSEVPQRYAYADPAALPPLGVTQVLCHGGRDQDVPPEMSRRFASAAQASGDDVILLEWPHAGHLPLLIRNRRYGRTSWRRSNAS